MKTKFSKRIKFVPLLATAFVMLQSFVIADLCSEMKIFESGLVLKTVLHDTQDKVLATAEVRIDSILSLGSSTEAFGTSEIFDAKGKSLRKQAMSYHCIDEDFEPDFMQGITDFIFFQPVRPEKRINGCIIRISPLLYPLNIQKGDTLPGGSMQMVVQESWGASTVQAKWERRVCLGDDTVMVGGKAYNTKKIQTFCSIRLKKGPVTMGDVKYSITEWFSPGYGILKTESFQEAKPVRNTRVISIKEGE